MRPIRTFLKTWNEANSASIRAKDAKKKWHHIQTLAFGCVVLNLFLSSRYN